MAPPGAAADSADAGPSLQALEDLLPSDEDLLYEEELLRNPYSLRMWWRYLEARRDAPPKRRYLLFERALKALPGSYKVRAGIQLLGEGLLFAWCSFFVWSASQGWLQQQGRARAAESLRVRLLDSCGTRTCGSARRRCGGFPSRTPPSRR